MLSEEGATEVWLSLLLTSLSLPLAIKNLKRGKTSSYERHPQYLRMVGFQEKNLFQLSLFLEFFSKRRKCLPEVEFFPWVFGLSFVLEFQFFRRPVWKKELVIQQDFTSSLICCTGETDSSVSLPNWNIRHRPPYSCGPSEWRGPTTKSATKRRCGTITVPSTSMSCEGLGYMTSFNTSWQSEFLYIFWNF